MLGSLYLIRNKINSKVYVGKTYIDPSVRFIEHKRHAKTKQTRPLYRAINKYGFDNFYIEVLGKYPEGILENKEIEIIKELDSYNNGYNATIGGDGRRYLSITDEDVIISYFKHKSGTKAAEELSVSRDTVERILKSHNIKLQFSGRKPVDKDILWLEQNMVYSSITDLVKEIKKINSKASDSVIRTGILRVCRGDRNSYLKQHFKLI